MEPETVKKCICTNCGADITRDGKRYPYGAEGGAYCEKCFNEIKIEKIMKIKEPDRRALSLYRFGLKPSAIAHMTGLSVADVLEITSWRKRRKR